MTVTLEDVGYILGLPVVGRPVVGDGIDVNMHISRGHGLRS